MGNKESSQINSKRANQRIPQSPHSKDAIGSEDAHLLDG